MNKLKARIAAVCATLLACTPFFAACQPKDPLMKGKTIVEYWTSSAMETAVTVKNAIDWYNQNNTDNIYILYQNKPSGSFNDLLNRQLSAGVNGPDIFTVGPQNVRLMMQFGKNGVLENLTPYLERDSDGLDVLPNTLQHYRYDRDKMSVNADDPLLALPMTMSTALLGYNATAMKKQGIKIISVDAEDIDAFNEGAPDNYGKTKADYGIQGNVRARGFDRWDGTSVDKNYIKGTFSSDGENFTANTEEWTRPEYNDDGTPKEQMIFNNRIAMSWDEVEDLGRIMTGYSSSGYYPNGFQYRPTTDWGFYTRYWFAYGWSVGGAACKDPTGNGDWEFTLGEKTRYCVLREQVGEEKDLLTDPVVTDVGGRPIFVAADKVGSYQLGENQYFADPMPSQYQAFERFFYLQKPKSAGGLYIGPRQSSDIGGSTELAFFTTGRMCMFGHLETTDVYSAVKAIGDSFEWDVAPVPVYKEYDENGEVKNKGAEMFYSYNCSGVSMWTNSDEKEASYKVMKFLSSGEYQRYFAETGLMLSPSQKYNEVFLAKTAQDPQYPKNMRLYADTLPMRFQDENTYFSDASWVTNWSEPLNSQYRENDRPLSEFLEKYTQSTNDMLKSLKEKTILR